MDLKYLKESEKILYCPPFLSSSQPEVIIWKMSSNVWTLEQPTISPNHIIHAPFMHVSEILSSWKNQQRLFPPLKQTLWQTPIQNRLSIIMQVIIWNCILKTACTYVLSILKDYVWSMISMVKNQETLCLSTWIKYWKNLSRMPLSADLRETTSFY